MNGGDLRFHISRKTFTEEAVRFWIAQLGCAVRYIHQQGIVHRDIKPSNVMLDASFAAKLGDFGVEVKVLAAYPGPVVTLYELEPAPGSVARYATR